MLLEAENENSSERKSTYLAKSRRLRKNYDHERAKNFFFQMGSAW